jgi:hypothetical protein
MLLGVSDAALRNRFEARSPGVRGAPSGACPLSPRPRRGRGRVCRNHRQVVGRSSGPENRCGRPFAGVASTLEVRYVAPEGAQPGKIAYRGSPVPAVRLRCHILLLLDTGHSRALIAAVLFTNSATINRWRRAYLRGGIDAVLAGTLWRRPSGSGSSGAAHTFGSFTGNRLPEHVASRMKSGCEIAPDATAIFRKSRAPFFATPARTSPSRAEGRPRFCAPPERSGNLLVHSKLRHLFGHGN